MFTAVFLISGTQGFLSLLPRQEQQPATSAVCGTEPRQQRLQSVRHNPLAQPQPGHVHLGTAQGAGWESRPPFWATNRIWFLSPKTGVLTPCSWHYCDQPGLYLMKQVSHTGAAEGLWVTRPKPGGMEEFPPLRAGTHPPHTPCFPPAGNRPCEQQGSHGVLLLQESKLAWSGTLENIHLTFR